MHHASRITRHLHHCGTKQGTPCFFAQLIYLVDVTNLRQQQYYSLPRMSTVAISLRVLRVSSVEIGDYSVNELDAERSYLRVRVRVQQRACE